MYSVKHNFKKMILSFQNGWLFLRLRSIHSNRQLDKLKCFERILLFQVGNGWGPVMGKILPCPEISFYFVNWARSFFGLRTLGMRNNNTGMLRMCIHLMLLLCQKLDDCVASWYCIQDVGGVTAYIYWSYAFSWVNLCIIATSMKKYCGIWIF